MSPRIIILRPPIVRVCLRYSSRAPQLHPGLARFYSSSKDSSLPPEFVGPSRDVVPNAAEEATAAENIMEPESPEMEQGISIGEVRVWVGPSGNNGLLIWDTDEE